MDDEAEHHTHPVGKVDRRQFLRCAAVGTGVFVVPTIITMAPAGAQEITSPPPEPRNAAVVGGSVTEPPERPAEKAPSVVDGSVTEPPESSTEAPPPGVGGAVTPQPSPVEVAGAVITPRGAQVAGRSELPRTGADLDDLVVAGMAAAVGGAALVMWSADADT